MDIGQVTILNRDGHAVFDAPSIRRERAGEYAVRPRYSNVRIVRVSGRTGVEWRWELRQVAAYDLDSNQMAPETADLLMSLQETALREIAPAIPLPAGSRPSAELQRRLGNDLVDARHVLARFEAVHDRGAAASHTGPAQDLDVPVAIDRLADCS